MIERFFIAHLSGVILYDYGFDQSSSLQVDPFLSGWLVKTLIERSAFRHEQMMFHHLLDNKADIVFVAVHQRAFTLPFNIEQLLEVTKLKFVEQFLGGSRPDFNLIIRSDFASFDPIFQKILSGLMSVTHRAAAAEKKPQHSQAKKTKKGKSEADFADQPGNDHSAAAAESSESTPESAENAETPAVTSQTRRPSHRGHGGQPKGRGSKDSVAPQRITKKLREKGWGGVVEYNAQDSVEFDRSKPASQSASGAASSSNTHEMTLADFNLTKWGSDEDEEFVEDAEFVEGLVAKSKEQKQVATASKGFFSRYLGTLTNRTIEAGDLKPVMIEFAQHLESKNVASEVAKELCLSVGESLEGKNLPSFTRLESSVRESLSQSLLKILTPKRQIDVLRDALEKRASGSPYIITFCGVNGVGKSTSLAKIASWLKSNGLRVLIVACDTFRSAAIEQLEVHANRLGIELYQQGYGKTPAIIAQNAIRVSKGKADVVLIDTAGRMQDNEPLMKCLCTLIQMNDPDLVLFVGEALVGNDGVDQLSKFNEALCRLSRVSGSVERSIDGIVLTKFDTIDDKVGAALSMVYTICAPILFLGTGQRYSDLKQMIPAAIVRSLLR